MTIAAGMLWFLFSLWLSRSWIKTLGEDITTPLAILVITGIALIPGYLNIQLLVSILVDRPPPLRLNVAYPPIALLVAAYNEEESIAETLDYALRTGTWAALSSWSSMMARLTAHARSSPSTPRVTIA